MSFAAEDDLSAEYVNWTKQTLEELRALLSASAEEALSSDVVLEIYGHAHNLKGMGSSFDYPLMTEIGGLLCANTNGPAGPKEVGSAFVQHYLDAMQAVMDHRLTGDGGEKGQEVMTTLRSRTEA